MKFLVIAAAFMAMLGCKNAEKNSSSGSVPESMSCPGSLDPNQACPDTVQPTGRVNPESVTKPVKPDNEPINKEISGTCEMLVKGEKTPRTCEELQLTVESIRGGETRHAQISGSALRFTDLTQKKYRFRASSEKFWVKAKTGELSPGQMVKIRVIANPKTKK